MILLVLMLLPLVFVGVLATRPAEHARSIALLGSLVSAVVALILWRQFDASGGGQTNQFELQLDWIPALGLRLDLGIDSVSLLLILLTCLLGPLCITGSWSAITKDQRTFYGWLLGLQAAMIGVFAARDLVLFYICFEFTLVPMYILISRFGSTNRRAAGIKFFLYTFTGSLLTLAGLVYVAWFTSRMPGGEWTLNITQLAQGARAMSATEQGWVLAAMLAGFAVKVPLFPVHTWLPLAHTEAPTAGSVILAGVLLKLGTYGIYRFVLPFVPAAVAEYAPIIATLSIIGIIYAGLICWVQTDVKKLVAYSSVSHLGFCVLGLMSLNHAGLQGSVLYMINHGLSTGALFLLVGFMYERYHTRSMRELGGLATKMPVWTCFMVFFTMASVGLPGLNGFISEFLCMMGAFQAGAVDGAWASYGRTVPGVTWGVLGPWYAFFAGFGVIIAAIYLLFLVGKICFGPLVEPKGHDDHGPLPADLTGREIWTLMPLAILCLLLGLFPSPVMDLLEPSVTLTVETVRAAAEGRVSLPVGVQPIEVVQSLDGLGSDLVQTETGAVR